MNKNLLKTIEQMKAKMKGSDSQEISKLMVAQTDTLTENRKNVQLRQRQKNWRSMQRLSPMSPPRLPTCPRGQLSFGGRQ